MELSDNDIKFILEAVEFYIEHHADGKLAESVRDKFVTGMLVEDGFNPYTDPETRALLSRAGIATHGRR